MHKCKRKNDTLQLVSECWQNEMDFSSQTLQVLDNLVQCVQNRLEADSDVRAAVAAAKSFLDPTARTRGVAHVRRGAPQEDVFERFAGILRDFMGVLQTHISETHHPFQFAQSDAHIYQEMLQNARVLLSTLEGGDNANFDQPSSK